MIRRSTFSVAAASAAFALSTLTRAAAARADDLPAATKLFEEAIADVEAARWDDGCPKFEAAIRLHASASIAINIARCQIHYGKLATAWGTFQRALGLVVETEGVERQKALEDVARKEMAEIEPRIPHVVIHFEGAPPAGMVVTKDGAEGILDSKLPVDPGEHVVAAQAPDRTPFTEKFTIAAAEERTVTIKLPATKPEAPGGPAPDAEGGLPLWTLVVGGAGIVAGGVAIGFLIDDVNASVALRENCFSDATGTGCRPGFDREGYNERKNVGGGVALGVGIGAAGLLTTAIVGIAIAGGSSKTSTALSIVPSFTSHDGGLLVRGAW
jgi:hypothetical protein